MQALSTQTVLSIPNQIQDIFEDGIQKKDFLELKRVERRRGEICDIDAKISKQNQLISEKKTKVDNANKRLENLKDRIHKLKSSPQPKSSWIKKAFRITGIIALAIAYIALIFTVIGIYLLILILENPLFKLQLMQRLILGNREVEIRRKENSVEELKDCIERENMRIQTQKQILEGLEKEKEEISQKITDALNKTDSLKEALEKKKADLQENLDDSSDQKQREALEKKVSLCTQGITFIDEIAADL